jgi:hypothetical protein
MFRPHLVALALVLVAVSALAQSLPRVRRHEAAVGVPPLSYGFAVATIDDVDFDLVDDYVVGSPEESLGNPGLSIAKGVVRVYSGATGAVLFAVGGPNNNDRMGWSVGGGGDINGDGVPDFIAGLPYGQNSFNNGNVRAYSGANGGLIWASFLTPLDGYRVANAGDLNGDGLAEVLVSRGSFTAPGPALASNILVLDGNSGQVLFVIPASSAGASSNAATFGISLAGAHDTNGDGFNDILVGYSTKNGPGVQSGAVYVYSGSDFTILHVLDGAPAGTFLGHSVAWTGDLDGDGVPEIVAGGSGSAVGGVPGVVRVYSGFSGSLLRTHVAAAVNDGFGVDVAGGADLDGDGITDYATSTPEANPTGPPVPPGAANGAVIAFSGATGLPIGTVVGQAPGSSIGTSLAMVRDVNFDGFAEVVVGSPRDDGPTLLDAGSVELVELAGHRPYGFGNSLLQLSCQSGPAGIASAASLTVAGAQSLDAGIIAADLAPGSLVVPPSIPVLVGLTPGLIVHPVTYDFSGVWSYGFSLRSPPLAGTVIYVQAFDLTPGGIAASAAVELLFCH